MHLYICSGADCGSPLPHAQGAKEGSLDFNLISLFPPTYKNRKNGLRIDIAETLASYSVRQDFL
jgi:hypothetical protein